jgi:cellulose synthase/poly-beta-1,6-N-acetylglucosamine synthase-like glycosyltransferase
LFFWLGLALYLAYGRSRMHYLHQVPVAAPFTEPAVVIIIAVRNEETHLAQALQSVIQLQYNRLRILIVNDRSTDGTAAILQNFSNEHPHITVTQITQLPQGWLGKNHALYSGYQSTTEEWMLFTDADVVFEKDTVQKAMRYATSKGLDHLTVLPEVESRSKWLNSMLSMFLILLEIKQRPWDVHKPHSKASLGIGAFNLVRRAAYEKGGTHTAIALRPDDDLKLGERLKASGAKADAIYGSKQIGLEWYTSVKEFVNGLMKNTFSVFDYNIAKVVVTGVLPLLLLLVLPLPLLLLQGDATERWMAAGIFISQLLLFSIRGGIRTYAWYAWMVPLAGGLLIYILLRSAWLTIQQGGIYWRESFYPLKELKKAR